MNPKPLYIVIAAVLAVGAWLFRYEVITPGDRLVYRLDRWTGSLAVAGPEFIRKLDYEKPEPPQAEGWWEQFPRADQHPSK